MLARVFALPLIVILMGIGAVAMLVPAAHGYATRDFDQGRAFFYAGIAAMIVTVLVGLASTDHKPRRQTRSHLLALFAAYGALPVMLGLPLVWAVPDMGALPAYFEMVSALTTTGATVFDDPDAVSHTVHLWRALVGWLGGLFAWVTAIAILAPMNLGGFEVLSAAHFQSASAGAAGGMGKPSEGPVRLVRYGARLIPIYAGLTAALWVALIIGGDTPYIAFCHALSTLSTSGISPVGGLGGGNSGVLGEILVFSFLIFALSRETFANDQRASGWRPLVADREFTMGIALVLAVPALLFLRHWVVALDAQNGAEVRLGLHALWGGVFTTMSFLTTAGFTSTSWEYAQNWSGMTAPGILLLGLSMIGGGVATTAGGVKLLRVYALLRHGERELEKLTHPNSIGGAGAVARRVRRQGAFLAWIFFMLFAMSICIVTVFLSALGQDFESAIIFAVAALSNAGPLADVAGAEPLSFGLLSPATQVLLAFTMVVGRLEALAIIALLNPDLWRN